MDDLTEPWLELPVIVGAYTDQERMDLTLRGIPPVVREVRDDPEIGS